MNDFWHFFACKKRQMDEKKAMVGCNWLMIACVKAAIDCYNLSIDYYLVIILCYLDIVDDDKSEIDC
jgi:hypothetical protein